jgi:predicted AAA+ superfamily ATPase
MQELKLNSGIIVTRNQKDIAKVQAGNINIIPAWQFLLEQREYLQSQEL